MVHRSELFHPYFNTKIVAAFQGMPVSPSKHSYRIMYDYQESGVTTGQTDAGQSDPLCAAMLQYKKSIRLRIYVFLRSSNIYLGQK